MHKGLKHKSAVGRLQAVKTEAEKAWGLEVSSLPFAFSAKPKRELDFLPEGRWETEMDFLNTEGRARKGLQKHRSVLPWGTQSYRKTWLP